MLRLKSYLFRKDNCAADNFASATIASASSGYCALARVKVNNAPQPQAPQNRPKKPEIPPAIDVIRNKLFINRPQ